MILEPVGVVGYDNVLEIPMDFTDTSPLDVELSTQMKLPKRDYKALWKRVILDQVLLIRMEKANSSLKGEDYILDNQPLNNRGKNEKV